MWLQHLRLEAFRAFNDTELTLPETGLVLVVGANNSGKSALLSAIDVLRQVMPDAPITNTSSSGPAKVVGTFVVEDTIRDLILAGSSGQRMSGEALRRIRVVLEVRTTANRLDVVGIEAALDNGEFDAIARLTSPNSEWQIEMADLRRWAVDEPLMGPFNRSMTVSGNDLGSYLWSSTSTTIQPILDRFRQWAGSVYHFGAIRPGTTRQRQSAGADVLAPTGENLPEVLLRLSTGQTNEWDAIRRVMADLVPDAGVPLTPVVGSQVELAFADVSGVRRNLQDLGSGVEQLLMMSVVGETHVRGGMLLIEEPETTLHPGAQRALLRHLAEWSTVRPDHRYDSFDRPARQSRRLG